MKVNTTTIEDLVFQLRQYFQRDTLNREDVNDRPPLRLELFSADQMEQHANFLASTHTLGEGRTPELLLNRLSLNEELLFRVTRLLQDAVKEKKVITPAGEWLLDNFYLIEEQIRIGKRHLPKGYSKGLPRLASGKSSGFPRVYDIAIEIISHSDGHVDIHTLSHFIASYQKVNYLTLGELWAVPIMLRLALLENLSRVAARIAVDRIDEDLAHYWAESILEKVEKDPKNLVLVIADMARSKPPMNGAFVAAFTRKLQWKVPDLTLPVSWIEQHLSEMGMSINSMVLAENQQKAADQVSMSNSISSLRFLAKTDWREFVEALSVVEQTLREDAADVYSKMDFSTRDWYRHVVEKLAKKSNLTEHEVAQIALDLGRASSEHDQVDKRKAHVGYYLVGLGASQIEKAAKVKHTFTQSLWNFFNENGYGLFVSGAWTITLLVTYGLYVKASSEEISPFVLAIVTVLVSLGASHFAITLVNWLATLSKKPSLLPKMNFSLGIPHAYRTLVVVPTMLSNRKQVLKLLEDLEVRFLANRDPNLLFGLLTDFKDATHQTLPEDNDLIEVAEEGIDDLNLKYGRINNDTFFLFHRPRQWNIKEKVWMGYERKRGKLGELNQLLRGGDKKRFAVIVGDERVYQTVNFVITLDTDTQLPRDSAWRLVGILAHPLNRAVYSEKHNRVVEGYGIIQPRIAISLHGATRTLYTSLHENDSGIDPYTHAVSDVYQDVFQEGSFIGKGIYEIDVFEKALQNRFPENRILSHDLLEGSYARCGFASDVQLYEEYPSRYKIDVSRRHRWIRGDWQIANWFLPFVPSASGKLQNNPVSALSRWKIFDNLRRSFVPITFTLLYLIGWFVLPSAGFWTACVTALIILPSLIISGWSMTQKPKEVLLFQHILNSIRNTYHTILQAAFTIICLPYEAYISVDAIVRTTWRILISRKKLLEWNPSGFVQNSHAENLVEVYLSMIVSPLLGITAFVMLLQLNPWVLMMAAPFLILWTFAPTVVWWLSKPLPSVVRDLTLDERYTLRELSRKTWAFFEDLITEADNWLPPDNLQQYPIPVVAHRTSPTNIGLSLLANLTALDFGYIPLTQFIERTTNTFDTLKKLDRYQGHFYNWYDTQSLQILHPRYISTVDSGNLAGHLLTLRQGFIALKDRKIMDRQTFEGFYDTLRIIGSKIPKETIAQWESAQKDVVELLMLEKPTLLVVRLNLEQLIMFCSSMANKLQQHSEGYSWIIALGRQAKYTLDDLMWIAPWISPAPIPQKFRNLKIFQEVPTLAELASIQTDLEEDLAAQPLQNRTVEEEAWLEKFRARVMDGSTYARDQLNVLNELAIHCAGFAEMEYDFLYDKSQHLLAIGYNAEVHHRDASFYDLLASEARLSTFVAVAQGKIPQESWFSLGRRLTTAGNTPVLLSWSGSMFEYLMPMLVMPSYKNTLLDETIRGTVKKQIEHGRLHDLPWGVSESCYNVVDSQLIYQYRAFGIPGLGFKRGLGEDIVIAPYATVMALMVDQDAAIQNLDRLRKEGFEGKYGFFESVDYTPSRLPRGQSRVLIQTFMAHHQGMSLLSLAYVLLNQPMQKRFEADQEFQTVLLLLQERVPKTMSFYSAATDMQEVTPAVVTPEMRVINTADTPSPEVQLLSNGSYHVMVSNAGGGYSRWKDLAVTRWREDSTCDNWGMFCYIRDMDKGEFWSTAHQPTLKEADHYAAVFSQGRVEFRRLDHDIETHTEIIVSPEDDIEIRRVHLVNRSRKKRKIEITSYAEVVLAMPMADAAHPAFSNLFVQTEVRPNQQAIMATRRARSHDEEPPWMIHLMKFNGERLFNVSFETDRDKFIGRGNTIAHPKVMKTTDPLTGSEGSVLDPIVAIQYRITLGPDDSIAFDMVTGMAKTREDAQLLIDKYQDAHLRDRAFELSWTHSQVVLRQINATERDAQLFGRLASAVIYFNPAFRANPNVLLRNVRGQSALWSYSISGDLPIVLLRLSDSTNITLVKQLVQAHAYWQLTGLAVDLVVINEDHSGYRQILQDHILGMTAAGIGVHGPGKHGGIFIRAADQIPNEDWILFQTIARVIISDTRGSLTDQINKRKTTRHPVSYLTPTVTRQLVKESVVPDTNLTFYNGYGGFSKDGREYIIHSSRKKSTPLPWSNVLANKNFGTIVTESGPSYTWAENAHEFRLTPWHNDPVSDRSGEAFYIRDEETGRYWSPMPLQATGHNTYTTRHGFGYSIFEYIEEGIATEVCIYVDLEASIKFTSVKIKNQSAAPRKLSVTGYAEWVMGDLRDKSIMHVVSEVDPTTHALLAHNPYSIEFANYLGFFDVDEVEHSFTTDRTEFVGRNGTLAHPDAMKRTNLSGKYGAGLDACAAMQIPLELEAGAEREIIFRMGAGKNHFEVLETIKKFKGRKTAHEALRKVHQFWSDTLNNIQVETPDQALNIFTNGWMVYQVLASRLWGRSGFYQSGGAFGFRDQLQDVMALMHAKPELTREQIVLAASRQFKDGDVQHWWHPPLGRGVRTQCSDDYLWLPFVTSRYVVSSGDENILNEEISFLDGRPLNAGEESYYDLPLLSEERATLYEHCKRAVKRCLRFGEHGLPLIGSGDWNDGMNMVGIHGKGESVWLAFFLFDVLKRFIPMAQLRGDSEFEQVCQQQSRTLAENINAHAWDGDWYVRAYYDDGTPLGSSKNIECRIDSISQSWSVLSGAGEAQRIGTAMNSVEKHLVKRENGLIQLLDPPFNFSDKDPGYIKGYVPGVRENGGQYTHAAIWMVMAFAHMGDTKRTWELLNMINPINHGRTLEEISVYKTEPYVVAADVYGVSPHNGRGGWTWYTGSAGWMYQLIIESFLGLKRKGDQLWIEPCLPKEWPSVKVRYRFKETFYTIIVEQHEGNVETEIVVDEQKQIQGYFNLVDDKVEHHVRIQIPIMQMGTVVHR